MTHKNILITSTLVGFFIGFVFLSVGLIHNPQCEFYCEGWIDWEYIFFFLGIMTIFFGGLFALFVIAYKYFYEYDVDT